MMNKSQAESLLQQHGIVIPWDKLNWTTLMQIIAAIIAIFSAQPKLQPVMRTSGKEHCCDPTGCCKAHFEAIAALAACGCDCCDQPC